MRVRDDSWAAVLRSLKCRANLVTDGGRTNALERLGLYEAVIWAKVCQHFEGEKCMWRLRACSSFFSLNSSVYRPNAASNSGTLSWRINPPRRNRTVPGSSYLVITVWRWNVEQCSIVSSKYVGSIIAKNNSHRSVVKRALIASANLTCSTAAQSMQRPTAKGRARSI
ncbi:hypothetical protein GOBAR_AA03507 [Gossypium barbadense]|uniref:Uncharacterized protein n=1 Tax=Gossypium barbadense TaxID=3634 RepID=A0A2P5YN88_GOSBA|nr:hypothetical protein GOBAR_AA03507 [Gossypium barbadense]